MSAGQAQATPEKEKTPRDRDCAHIRIGSRLRKGGPIHVWLASASSRWVRPLAVLNENTDET